VKSAAGSARSVLTPGPTATCVVTFLRKPRRGPQLEQPGAMGRVPRVARLLALAHRIDGMIGSGELRDWADAASLTGVTRARMTQIANLLLLAPEIQEAILTLPPVFRGRSAMTEHELRRLLLSVRWNDQERAWSDLRRASSISLGGAPPV
jgi:hypothetical protein